MIRRIFCSLLALIFILPPSYQTSAITLPSNPSRPSLQLLQSNTAGVILDLSVPDYNPVADLMMTTADQQLSFPGYEFANDPGKPQLPLITTLVGVPPDARLEMQIVMDDAQLLPGSFRVPAAPTPVAVQPVDSGESQSPAWNYLTDSSVYSSDASYPASPVTLSSDVWVRDHRLVRVSFYPFQYNPVRRNLMWHRNIRIEIHFYGDNAALNLGIASGASVSQPDPFGVVMQSSLINYDTAKSWRSLAPAVRDISGIQSLSQSSSPRYKVTIDHDGVYQLTYNDLLQAGVDLAHVNPQNFHLTSQGQPVAMQMNLATAGSFGKQDTLTFYGQRFYGDRLATLYASEADYWITFTQQLTDGQTVPWRPTVTPLTMEKYTNDNVYWLEVGSSPSSAINQIDGKPAGTTYPSPLFFEKTVHVKKGGCDRCYWAGHFTGQEDIYSDRIQDTITHSYTTTLDALASLSYSATVKAELVAVTDNPYNSPDHHAQFFMNAAPSPIQDIQWDGKSRYHMEVKIPQSMLAEGVNTLKFRAIRDGSTIAPYYAFDWFEITYASRFQAVNNIAAFTGDAGGAWKYQVGGFTTKNITIFDITQPLTPTQIIPYPVIGDTSPYTVTFVASHPAGEKFIAVGSDGFQSPKSIASYQGHLTSINPGAEYVLIAPSDLITATQALADYRQATGLQTMVVNAGDVYNEYNFGIFNPIAFKNFFADAYKNWLIKPVYAVLVGDGNWNMRGFNPGFYGTAPIYMPPNLAWVDPWLGEADSSNLLAAFVGNDPLPDLLISRMPVQNPGELYNILNKIITYESTPVQDWQRRMLFLADNNDPAGDFAELSNEMINDVVPSGFAADRIYVDDYYTSTVNGLVLDRNKCGPVPFTGGPGCPAVNHLITETLSTTGTLFLTYSGHGSIWTWASEQILLYHPDDPKRKDDFAIDNIGSLQNGTMLPVVLSLDCQDGEWIHPITRPSLAELFLTSPNRGAVSTFSPTGYGLATGHDILARGFYDEFFRKGNWELGAASLAARLAVYNNGYYDELIETYTIFGDPALKVRSPYQSNLVPAQSEVFSPAGKNLPVLFNVNNQGSLTDTFSLTVTGSAWHLDAPLFVGPLPAGANQEITVTVHIPPDAPVGTMDTAHLRLSSLGDLSKIVTSTLETAVTTSTAVTLTSFDAADQPGQIGLSWDTAHENDISGFYIRRSQFPNDVSYGARIPVYLPDGLQVSFIPPKGDLSTPAHYEVYDRSAQNNIDYYYWLEVVDNNSSSTFVGARQSRLRYWQFMPIVNK
jgi:hypothetical protein